MITLLRLLYTLFAALAAASLTATLPLSEMWILEQTPYIETMAHDPVYGYETYRTLGIVVPWIAALNAVIGGIVAWKLTRR